ncbi:MAG: hypothetical protein IK079_01330, partial [Desulfovibrio sp.]|nr:hypothetical protein [Desulfovibrio sp.]
MDKNKTLGHFKMQYPNRDNRIRSRKINIHSLSNGTDLKLLALKKNEDLAHEEIFSLNFFSYKEIHTEEKETVSQFNFKKLKKDEWFRWRFTPIEVLIKLSKKIALGIYFSGHALIKIGLSVPGHSFIWLGDQEWKAKKIEWKCHTIDLERFENGFLEISILPIEDSYFYASGLDHAKKIELDEAQVLYRFISPSLDLCCEEPLYYRFSGTKTWYSFEENVVYLYKNSSVDLVTYFNSFSGAKWYRYTNVETVDIFLDFMGDAVVDFVNYVGEESIVLQRWQIRSYTRALFKCETKCFPTEGVSGIIIYANAKSILYGGGYCTSVPEIQDIKLGISITTFKREKQVIKSVQRLGTAINNHPYYKNCIDISVVDNGATLEDADVPCATLIKNKNLGGTGGFTRGLVAYTENGTYTHCLFMDDDAQCEAESIFKSISFLRHALDKKTALSGAMLYANLQFLQWENGAWFDEGCHSLKR